MLSPDVRSYRTSNLRHARNVFEKRIFRISGFRRRLLTKVSSPELLRISIDPRYQAGSPVFSRRRRSVGLDLGCTDRHSSIPNFSKAWWTYVGDAMWRSRWAVTLYILARVVDITQAPGFSRPARETEEDARPIACPPQNCPIRAKLLNIKLLIEQAQYLYISLQQNIIIDFLFHKKLNGLYVWSQSIKKKNKLINK